MHPLCGPEYFHLSHSHSHSCSLDSLFSRAFIQILLHLGSTYRNMCDIVFVARVRNIFYLTQRPWPSFLPQRWIYVAVRRYNISISKGANGKRIAQIGTSYIHSLLFNNWNENGNVLITIKKKQKHWKNLQIHFLESIPLELGLLFVIFT